MQSTQNDQNNISDQNSTSQNEGEISLIDIVSFVQESWKKLLAASIVGAVLGLTGWFFLGQYQAEYVLLNNNNNNNNSYALDIVSWKMLQKSLPNLAAQVVEENKIPQDQAALYKTMAQEQWWQKNVSPAYALSKADTKDLGAISKDLDTASTTILSLTITAAGSSKEKAIDNVRTASQFLRSGSAYLQLHSLLNGYESQTISEVANLQQKITTTQIEMGYQQERAKSLEDLHKRFPGGVNVNGQVVDPKDSGAKYMPISTQIIAVNNDINQSKESLQRLRDRLGQIALIKTFIDQAIPLQDQTFDGLVLNEQLLAIESALRSKLAKGDNNGQAILGQLRTQLLAIQVRFTKGLEANTPPVAIKKGMIKTTAGGLVAAFFLMLLALLGQRLWLKTKNGSAQ
ncbi:hypothetical protein G6722_06625 [Polynucleobacter paneuropaeus]|nr:hypothetical protein [Polynucleobacter paneuropaeus]